MATVFVDLKSLDSKWANACRKAETGLNTLFKKNGINVVLTTKGPQALAITVITDPSIQGTALHGRTSAETDAGRMLRSTIRLPVNVTISTPAGIRDAGIGPLEVIAAHEFVHALGHAPHNSLLMTQTWTKEPGTYSAAGDILRGNGAPMPPLMLSSESIDILKDIWS